MEFHQIRYFLAACDHLNFTRAAEACHVSQPALTVAVRKLEEELGGALFLREGGRVALTELGQAMRLHLARIDETRRAASRAAREMLDPRGEEVQLGIYSTIGPGRLGAAIAAFQAAEPETAIVLHDVWGPRTYELLLSGAFDVAVVARHGVLPARLSAVPLYREEMVLAVAEGSPLAGRPVRMAELEGAVYLDRLRCEFRERIHADIAARGVALATRLRSEPEDWVQAAVAAGQGVTILPRDQIVLPGIAASPLPDLGIDRVIEVVTVADRETSPAAGRFVAHLGAFDWWAGTGPDATGPGGTQPLASVGAPSPPVRATGPTPRG